MGHIHFPAGRVSEFGMKEPQTTAREEGTWTYHILLAEDSSADVGLVRLALRDESLDHILHVAKDGEEAIVFIQDADRGSKSPPLDLLLLDMHLPKHNGEEILKCLRSTEHYAQTPVIVMSSSDAPADHETAQKHAALIYFRKPSTLAEFIELGKIVKNILTGVGPVRPGIPIRTSEGA